MKGSTLVIKSLIQDSIPPLCRIFYCQLSVLNWPQAVVDQFVLSGSFGENSDSGDSIAILVSSKRANRYTVSPITAEHQVTGVI